MSGRIVVTAFLMCIWKLAVAEPAQPTVGKSNQTTVAQSPWLDQASLSVLSSPARQQRTEHRLAAALGVGGAYAAFTTWAYFAWYRNHPALTRREIGGDGWFGRSTYAGGADKLGHAWATMTLARGGTAALRAGGWSRTGSALVSALLAEGLFAAVEVKDYYYYELSPGDLAFDTLGALAAFVMDSWPRADELVDFRVEYWPSAQYRYNVLNADAPCAKRTPGQPTCSRWNIAEDYSGETYLLAVHLGAIDGLRNWRLGGWSRYIDVSVGFESRNYKPPPTLEPPDVRRTQALFLGVSLNAQGIVDRILPKSSRARRGVTGVLEVLTPPLTVPIIGVERGTSDVSSGGA